MLRGICCFVPLAVWLTFAVAQAPSNEKYALLIGVQRYGDGSGLRTLEYPENDVNELAEVLTGQGYRVTVLSRTAAQKEDKDFLRPTAANIRDHLTAQTKRCKAGDTLLVAFSGHGAHLKTTDKLYFCPLETKLGDEKTLTAIDDVVALLDSADCKATSKVLMVDACRNDPADGRSGQTPTEMKSSTRPLLVAPKGGTVTLFSCSKGQISHESKTHKRGFLFHYVIEGLKGEAADKRTGNVTWLDLAAYVTREIPIAVSAEKGPTIEQTPDVMGQARAFVMANVKQVLPKAGEERSFEIAEGMTMTFCWIPPGKARLGDPNKDDNKEHEYTSKGFWLGKYEVTQAQWNAVMGKNPSHFTKVEGEDMSKFPVEMVSWEECQEFIATANQRAGVAKVFGKAGKFGLPHEDAWEYACRGSQGNKQPFHFGTALNGTQANCDGDYPYGTDVKGPYLKRTTTVGSYPANAWGLCDMHGNVLEWCDNTYEQSGNSTRVLRGGSWCLHPQYCFAAFRYRYAPASRYSTVGFRVCFCQD